MVRSVLFGAAALVFLACSGTDGSSGANGGSASGGAATGGSSVSGGAPGGGQVTSTTGGASLTGGAPVVGGSVGTGGSPEAGGAASPPGGSTSTTGGSPSQGGETTSGGTAPTGGNPSEGGGGGGTAAGGAGTSGQGGEAVAGTSGMTGSDAGRYKGVANSDCDDLERLGVSWWYNWTLSPGSCDVEEFVPMISGKNEKTEMAVQNALGLVANAGYDKVLGFNEPNKTDQANMSVEQVLSLWPAITESPAIAVSSVSTSGDAQAYFESFMQGVEDQGLRTDFIALHWYGWNAGSCDENASELEHYIEWAENIPGDRPLWITEWGCLNQSNPDPETVEAFFVGAIAMFERHARLMRYAWYPWTENNELVASDGSLTSLGARFAEAPSRR